MTTPTARPRPRRMPPHVYRRRRLTVATVAVAAVWTPFAVTAITGDDTPHATACPQVGAVMAELGEYCADGGEMHGVSIVTYGDCTVSFFAGRAGQVGAPVVAEDAARSTFCEA